MNYHPSPQPCLMTQVSHTMQSLSHILWYLNNLFAFVNAGVHFTVLIDINCTGKLNMLLWIYVPDISLTHIQCIHFRRNENLQIQSCSEETDKSWRASEEC